MRRLCVSPDDGSRLADLVLDGIQIPAASPVDLGSWRRAIREGACDVQVRGYSHVFVPTAGDGATTTGARDIGTLPDALRTQARMAHPDQLLGTRQQSTPRGGDLARHFGGCKRVLRKLGGILRHPGPERQIAQLTGQSRDRRRYTEDDIGPLGSRLRVCDGRSLIGPRLIISQRNEQQAVGLMFAAQSFAKIFRSAEADLEIAQSAGLEIVSASHDRVSRQMRDQGASNRPDLADGARCGFERNFQVDAGIRPEAITAGDTSTEDGALAIATGDLGISQLLGIDLFK